MKKKTDTVRKPKTLKAPAAFPKAPKPLEGGSPRIRKSHLSAQELRDLAKKTPIAAADPFLDSLVADIDSKLREATDRVNGAGATTWGVETQEDTGSVAERALRARERDVVSTRDRLSQHLEDLHRYQVFAGYCTEIRRLLLVHTNEDELLYTKQDLRVHVVPEVTRHRGGPGFTFTVVVPAACVTDQFSASWWHERACFVARIWGQAHLGSPYAVTPQVAVSWKITL